MASVAMNVITAAQNNNTIVFEQPAASQLQQKQPPPPLLPLRLLQISDDKDRNREISKLDLQETHMQKILLKGKDINT